MPVTGRSVQRARPRSRGATSIARWCWRRRSAHRRGVLTRRRRVGDGCGQPRARARERLTPPSAAAGDVHGRRRGGRGRVRTATRVRADLSVDVGRRGRRRRGGRRRRPGAVVPVCRWTIADSSARAARRVVRRAEHSGSRSTTEPAPNATRRPRLEPGRDRRPARRHHRGVGIVVGAAPVVRGAVARARPPERPRAPGVVVPTDRRDLRGRDDVVARDRRAAAATGTTGTRGCATRASRSRRSGWRRVPTRSNEFFEYMTTSAAGLGRARRRSADHVRHRRRARPHRTRASPPAGLARQRAGARRQRCVEPAPARRVRRAAQHASIASPTSSPTWRRPRRRSS